MPIICSERLIDARNQADSLAYSVEKTVNENRDRLPAAEGSRIDRAIAAVREAARRDDLGAIRGASGELQKASHAMVEHLYKQQAPGPRAPASEKDDASRKPKSSRRKGGDTMAIVRFDPFREFAALARGPRHAYWRGGVEVRMNRLFGDIYLRDEDLSRRGTWVPAVDIYETENHDLVIKVELPEMTREDIEVTVENSTLTLRGTRKLPADVTEDRFRRIERSYGDFNRSFTLPNTVDAAKVSAEYKNGVLVVTLPFREEAKPRTINVEVAA